ncbi:hypothetical protein [Chitinophaga eiseniae]|uniref:Uncharacterized protein n=1 Tax=Chitinophaga eiseniae TaxID=634771 RepID=A0A847SK59_9BACT|nr:hypothetical protein [Chitinophaga eiseniae]NLR82281.1 hypothetical protein [Chitinophaga eiseniae]
MEVPLCNLCKIKPATQTGSHIFSWSLIRSLVNKEGIRERENEVVFSFSEAFVKTYIGRQQSAEEKVIPIKGRPLNEEEIEETENENPFISDNILCPECEHMLSVLESVVNERVLTKTRKHIVKNTGGYDKIAIQDGDPLRLFIYSLAWRGAITGINNFEMLPEHSEILRNILHKSLSSNRTELLKNIEQHSNLVRSISLLIAFLEVHGKNDNFIYCSLSYKPYAMILNDLSFQIFFDDAPDNSFDPEFMGINNVIKKDELLMKNEANFEVAILSNQVRMQVNRNLNSAMKDIILKPAIELFSLAFQKFIQRLPHREEVQLFIQNVIKRGDHKLENYTPKDFVEAASETMLQLFPERSKP